MRAPLRTAAYTQTAVYEAAAVLAHGWPTGPRPRMFDRSSVSPRLLSPSVVGMPLPALPGRKTLRQRHATGRVPAPERPAPCCPCHCLPASPAEQHRRSAAHYNSGTGSAGCILGRFTTRRTRWLAGNRRSNHPGGGRRAPLRLSAGASRALPRSASGEDLIGVRWVIWQREATERQAQRLEFEPAFGEHRPGGDRVPAAVGVLVAESSQEP